MRIEDYALIGDMHTAALVGRDGSVDWLCLPRFDSGACFAALLGGPKAGRWLLAPAHGRPSTGRRYRDGTLVLETEWDAPEGCVRVLDFMPPRGEAPDVVRIVEGVRGRVEMRMEMVLRFDYGNVAPWVRGEDGELAAVAGPNATWLRAPVTLRHERRPHRTTASFAVSAGERVPFVLTWRESWLGRPDPADPMDSLAGAGRMWKEWLGRCTYEGEYEEAVRSSLLTLKALTYAPTGGLVAAATTSLPEQLGGPRNWDYRYSWLRDATFTLQALMRAGYDEEATAWRDWLLRTVAGDPADLQIMYTIEGARRIPEWTVGWLPGYEGSRPVRVGNAASRQFQLDVYGEVIDCLHLAREEGLGADEQAWDVQCALMEYLEGAWKEPDNGLWEMRGPRRDFTHSKILAWVAADRMVSAVERQGMDGPVARWRALREEIHHDVCTRGYDPGRTTFTQYYGSKGLDAALLLIPRLGFLPIDDPRVSGTVDAVRRELMEDGFVLRYRQKADDVDGLPGGEGTFVACSFWLADALALLGRTQESRRLFERLLSLRNDVGLLSEEYDVTARRQIGNVPQAYSHVSIVNTAAALARGGDARTPRARRHPADGAAVTGGKGGR
ncbi:glycoside hydrolase family 15 protein [Microbispora sp. ATCC PTA-5024]|uniref:glycoside hydrolase family 15 protein n=1 Tax=Microbispora sp. ATCC PTA-5024 TaxID=316330 RepID=UPI0003DDAC86|nr:glycoside hydrolase family 15 protein [Microbispora sp. ATCC PTA-5024]ETK37120.1 glucoamylase [Microbispora sp. ATCC PTA-5024]